MHEENSVLFIVGFIGIVAIISMFIVFERISLNDTNNDNVGMVVGKLVSDFNSTSTCMDSDNGNNIYVKGEINPPSDQKDRCYDLDKGPISLCAGSRCSLEEFYCIDINNDGTFETYTSSVSNTPCPNGCSDGACMQNNNILNNTIVLNIPDTVNSTPNTSILNTVKSISNISQILPTPVCFDSDDGKDYTLKGSLTVSNVAVIKTDFCRNGSILGEYYCMNISSGIIEYVTCPNGCSDGVCISVSPTPNQNVGLTLANYPQQVITSKGVPNALFIIGKKASIEDVIGITDLVASLQRYAGDNPLPTGLIKFDEDISDNDLYNSNVVLVGGMCANSATERIYGYESDCTAYDTDGIGYIKIMRNKNTEKFVLLIHGYSSLDTTLATKVIANWNDYKDLFASTDSVCVTGTLNNMLVQNCSDDLSASEYVCESLSTNVEGNNKLNILFIPDRVSADNLDSFKNELLNHARAFYAVEPFKSNKKNINFYFLRTTQPIFDGDYAYFDDALIDKVVKLSSKCNYRITQFMIVMKEDNGGQSLYGSGLSITNINSAFVSMHEFGHSFGGLGDIYNSNKPYDATEYLRLTINAPPAPNTDEAGCSKWCQSNTGLYQDACAKISDETVCKQYNRINTEYGWQCDDTNDITRCCVWLNDDEVDPFFKSRCVRRADDTNIGVDCLEGTGCYYGALYPGKWRPTNNPTIMGGENGVYDPVSIKALDLKIKCCYPQTCDNFPVECKIYSELYGVGGGAGNHAFKNCGTCNVD